MISASMSLNSLPHSTWKMGLSWICHFEHYRLVSPKNSQGPSSIWNNILFDWHHPSGFGGTLTKKYFKCAIGDFSIDVNPPDYDGYTNDLTEEEANLLDNLTHFQKLILVKCFKEEKVTFAISDFVCEVQGKTQFISVWKATPNWTWSQDFLISPVDIVGRGQVRGTFKGDSLEFLRALLKWTYSPDLNKSQFRFLTSHFNLL